MTSLAMAQSTTVLDELESHGFVIDAEDRPRLVSMLDGSDTTLRLLHRARKEMERRFGAVPVGLFVAPGVDGERGTVIASLRVSRHAPELNIAKYRRRFDEFVEEWWLEHIHESDIELTVDML